MQAALGRVQLQRLPEWVGIRRRNAKILESLFSAHEAVTVDTPPRHCHHSYYKFYAMVSSARLRPGWSRDRIVQTLQSQGIPCGCGSCCEIYLEEGVQAAGLAPAQRHPTARRLGEASLMFPVHPTLSEVDVHAMGLAALAVIDEASSSKPGVRRQLAGHAPLSQRLSA